MSTVLIMIIGRRELLISGVSAYRNISDDDLLAYLKGVVYRFKYLQTLRALAACAEVDAKLRE